MLEIARVIVEKDIEESEEKGKCIRLADIHKYIAMVHSLNGSYKDSLQE